MTWLRIRSSPCVPGSAASTSASLQDYERLAETLEPSAWSRGKHMPSQYWLGKCERDGWMNVLSGLETSATYPSTNFRPSTGSPPDIPVPLFQARENDWEKRTLVICGRESAKSCGLFDQEGSFSRTSRATSRSASIASFGTWRDSATAARSDCSRRRRSAHLTDGSVSSSSELMMRREIAVFVTDCARNQNDPTQAYAPGAEAWSSNAKNAHNPTSLIGKSIPVMPTPTVGDSRNSANRTANRNTDTHNDGTTLVDFVRMYPTPSSVQGNQVGRWDEWGGADNPFRGTQTGRGAVNPEFVEWMMGFPQGWTDCEPWEMQSSHTPLERPSSPSGGN